MEPARSDTRFAPGAELMNSPEQDSFDLINFLSVLWRGKLIISTFVVIGTLLGGYYAFFVAEDRFAAVARLAMDLRQNQVVDVESVVSGASTDTASLNTELEFIRTEELVERVVDDLKLVENPEFNPVLGEQPTISLNIIRGWIRTQLFGPAPQAAPPSAEAIRRATINNVRRAITVTGQRNTYIFNIRVIAGDSKVTAEIANSLAQFYLADQISNKFEATEFAINWLSDRVLELETDLKSQESEIQQISKESNLISSDVLDAQSIRAKDLRERLQSAEAALAVSMARQAEAQTLLSTATPRDVANFFQDQVLVNILARVQQGSAPQSLFDDRVKLLAANIGNGVERSRAQQTALTSALQQLEAQLSVQNADLVKLNNLRREAEATRVLYETFLSRLKETSVQIGLQRADSQILSLARRGSQVAPRRSRIIAQFLVLGGLIGTGLVMLRRFRHSGFRQVRELENATGLPVLGQIPRIPLRRRQGLMAYLKENPTSAAVEAVRNIRTSLLMSNLDNPPKIIMTTSAIPGEGKTTQSLSLAQNLSGLGKKVLLVEGDIRRRTFSQYFKNRSQHGLFSVVSGEVPFEDARFFSEELGADVLLGDRTAVNAADVFSSERFASFILHLREEYDYVVIDTPPVLAVPDARIIGQLVDAALFSVKWDSTGREQVIEGIRLLLSVGIKPNGLVMTQVDPKRMKRYGYGSRYGEYGKGYYDVK